MWNNPSYTYVELHQEDKAARAISALQGKPCHNKTLEASFAPARFDHMEAPDIHAGRCKAEREHQLDVSIRRSAKMEATRAAKVASEVRSKKMAGRVRANIASNDFLTTDWGK